MRIIALSKLAIPCLRCSRLTPLVSLAEMFQVTLAKMYQALYLKLTSYWEVLDLSYGKRVGVWETIISFARTCWDYLG